MSRSGGMGQLFKGMLIGIVLLLAIIGTMSILDKSKPSTPKIDNAKTEPVNIPAPSIKIASNNPATPSSENITTPNTPDQKPAETETEKPVDNFKPTLEGEKTVEEKEAEKPKPIQYGMLELGVINPETKEKLKADYVIFDAKDIKIAESKSTKSTSFKLPVGQYKVVTTLIPPKNVARKTEAIQTTKVVTIHANDTSSQTFELEPAPTIGILQVSAKNAKNGQAMKANFIVQKENGVTVATRQNVTASLFKLKAGSYKVTVRSGNNSDFRTIVIEPGESTQEAFKLQEAYKLGRVLVRIYDTKTNRPIPADIVIATSDGTTVQELKAVSQTEISLPAANYNIRVTGPNGQSSKKIRVNAGQSISEVFRFDAPIEVIANAENNANDIQITGNVKITAPKDAETTDSSIDNTADEANTTTESTLSTKATIQLFARSNTSKKPIKSNFYIQTTNGQHIAKKIYADSAEFELEPGTYRVTIRSKDRSNIIRTIELSAGQNINHTFTLKNNNSDTTTPPPVLVPPKPAPAPQKNASIANGFLNVSMNPARKTHFIVTTKAGKKIVELTSVPNGRFKLDTGQYVVTAIHNSIRRNKSILIRNGKTSRITFNANDFQPKKNNSSTKVSINKGVLKSRIVDRSGRPLRGNLTVTNRRGQVVARANAVTVGVFDLPPGPHTVIVSYQGLRGSERVNIVSRETTVQTFTISPNSAPPANNKAQGQNKEQSLKDMLREKIEQEIRKQF